MSACLSSHDGKHHFPPDVLGGRCTACGCGIPEAIAPTSSTQSLPNTKDSPSAGGSGVSSAGAIDLDAIEARANAATEGPWCWYEEVGGYPDLKYGNLLAPDGSDVLVLSREEEASDAVRGFIAHARTDVPALIAEVRRLQIEVRSNHETLQKNRWNLK